MRMMNTVIAATVALVVGAAAALAQTTPAAPAAPKAPTATAPAPSTAATTAAKPATTTDAKPAAANLKKAKTPEGQACSDEADAKQLHGKERKKFRAACMKGKTAAAAPAKKN
jgi:hypothetical protein